MGFESTLPKDLPASSSPCGRAKRGRTSDSSRARARHDPVNCARQARCGVVRDRYRCTARFATAIAARPSERSGDRQCCAACVARPTSLRLRLAARERKARAGTAAVAGVARAAVGLLAVAPVVDGTAVTAREAAHRRVAVRDGAVVAGVAAALDRRDLMIETRRRSRRAHASPAHDGVTGSHDDRSRSHANPVAQSVSLPQTPASAHVLLRSNSPPHNHDSTRRCRRTTPRKCEGPPEGGPARITSRSDHRFESWTLTPALFVTVRAPAVLSPQLANS